MILLNVTRLDSTRGSQTLKQPSEVLEPGTTIVTEANHIGVNTYHYDRIDPDVM